MTIISISLGDDYIGHLDAIQQSYGLKTRSDAVRTAISAALDELKELGAMSGTVEGVLIIVRGDHADPWVIKIQAKYQQLITTQLHSHLKDDKCLEVMVISGDASDLKDMLSEIRAIGKADYVKFVHGRSRNGL
jgi:CopG family nickel-responsive transcriptional regulator